MISPAENRVSRVSKVPSAISSLSMSLDKLIKDRGIAIIANNTPNSLISLWELMSTRLTLQNPKNSSKYLIVLLDFT